MFLVIYGRETSTGNKHCYPHCNENLIYVLLFGDLCGLSPNFHIHVSGSDLYITRISPHISCAIPFLEVLVSKFRYWFFAVQGNGLYFWLYSIQCWSSWQGLIVLRLIQGYLAGWAGPTPICYRLLSMFQFAKLRWAKSPEMEFLNSIFVEVSGHKLESV